MLDGASLTFEPSATLRVRDGAIIPVAPGRGNPTADRKTGRGAVRFRKNPPNGPENPGRRAGPNGDSYPETLMHSLTGSRRTSLSVRPRVEGLEARWTPADLTAVVSNGVLSITAVTADAVEGLTVLSGAAPGTVDVVPDTGTTVNGQPATAHFPGVTSVRVSLRGGDDRIGVEELEIPGSLTVQSGDGANFVDIYRSRIAGNVTVTSGNNPTGAEDRIFIESYVWVGGKTAISHAGGPGRCEVFNQVEIGGGLAINGGSGDDDVALKNVRLTGNARVNLGGGGNSARISDAFIAGSVAVTGAAEGDSVVVSDTTTTGSLTANLGGGDNSVSLDSHSMGSSVGSRIGRNLSIQTGSGVDFVALGGQQPVLVGGTLTVRTGDEVQGDALIIHDLTCLGAVDIDLGQGDDLCAVDAESADAVVSRFGSSFKVQAGGGQDIVTLGTPTYQKVMFARPPVLNGGGGDDTAYLLNYGVGDTNAPLTPLGFETINK
jgi:hypothetical protein